MNIFDTSELDRKIAEAEAQMLKGDEPVEKEELEQEVEESVVEKEEEIEEIEEEKVEQVESQDEEEAPTDPKGWKKLREKKKAAQQQAEEERKLREEREKELQQMRERLAKLEGREEARTKPEISKEPEDKEPDRDLDPEEHMRWEIRQLRKQNEEIKKQAEQAAALAKTEGVRRGLDIVEKDYIKSNKIADYEARLEHIKNVERNLIKMEYPTATDQQINSHLEAERLRLANEVYAKGQNPADYFYRKSEALGYKKTEPKQDLSDKPNIEAINRNMKKNSNLIGSSNVEKPGGVTPEKLVSMSIADLLNSKNERALDAAIKREEAKLFA